MSHNKIVFVTGTDTGVGKTVVTAGLAKALSMAGYRVTAVKPVESGCTKDNPDMQDGRLLSEATGQTYPTKAFDRLEAPLAPPVAADRQGRRLSMDGWCDQISQLAKNCDILLMEGAGGLLSPLTWSETNLDLILRCQARVLVVADNRLGVINQVLLVLRALIQEKIPISGVVLSCTAKTSDASVTENTKLIKAFSKLDRVFCLPYIENPEQIAALIDPVRGWIVS